MTRIIMNLVFFCKDQREMRKITHFPITFLLSCTILYVMKKHSFYHFENSNKTDRKRLFFFYLSSPVCPSPSILLLVSNLDIIFHLSYLYRITSLSPMSILLQERQSKMKPTITIFPRLFSYTSKCESSNKRLNT